MARSSPSPNHPLGRRNAAQQAAKELAEAQSEVKKIQEVGRA